MKTIITSIFSLFLFQFVNAQEPIILKCMDWNVQAQTGGLFTNFDNLNQTLIENQIRPFEGNPIFLNVMIKRNPSGKKVGYFLGYRSIHALKSTSLQYNIDKGSSTSRTLRSNGFVSGFDFYVVNGERFRFYPSLSIEINRTVLKIYDDIPVGASFSNTVGSSIGTKKYTTGKVIPNLGVQAEYRIPTFSHYTIVGVNAGYNLDYNSDWNYGDDLPVAFPDFKWSGFYFGISLGIETDCLRLRQYVEKYQQKQKS